MIAIEEIEKLSTANLAPITVLAGDDLGQYTEIKQKLFEQIGITCDERIADGFYFAKSLKIFDYILDNPNLLEKELDEKISLDI